MLRFARTVTGSTSPTLTFFHNSNSKLLHHLLGRLARHNERYTLDVRLDKLPLYGTYHFIHNECINVHAQNSRAFEKIFPALLSSSHTFCDMEAKKASKQKQFVPDLDLVSEDAYLDKVAHHTAAEIAPFVVDWGNKLVAVDDDGLDRIMRNYYSCGLQESSMVHETDGPDRVKVPKKTVKRSHAALLSAVHPHVAEFADLF